ncbi:MAG: hypothetical protein P8Y23_02155 [Candidatus Lokiarchaeota archaeon]
MNFIIDGDINIELLSLFEREKLPVTHIILYVRDNPIGNSSIFLPKELPSIKHFETNVEQIKKANLKPIVSIDSTCQGNLEAHIKQYEAINAFIDKLNQLEISEVLVSSPNILGYIKTNFPSIKVYVSYSQYITSINRGKIFFELGADSLILHSDIIRYLNLLKNFIKLKKVLKDKEKNYILPLNLGCNWGCIQWYQHHNLQSHRTISSPIFPDQEKLSNVNDEFDYPLLYCWKKRLEEPVNFLKAGWISPNNIEMYQELGYDNYLLFTREFSNEKVITILKSYRDKLLNTDFNEYINIPYPYDSYWLNSDLKSKKISLTPEFVEDFCANFPYDCTYPFEIKINEYCNMCLQKLHLDKNCIPKTLLDSIKKKIKEIEKGAVKM